MNAKENVGTYHQIDEDLLIVECSTIKNPSDAHMKALERATAEKTNENIELAKAMSDHQRKTFRRKHDA